MVWSEYVKGSGYFKANYATSASGSWQTRSLATKSLAGGNHSMVIDASGKVHVGNALAAGTSGLVAVHHYSFLPRCP